MVIRFSLGHENRCMLCKLKFNLHKVDEEMEELKKIR